MPAAHTTTAKLNWSTWPEGTKPWLHINEPPAGEKRTNVTYVPHEAVITDIRGQKSLTLDSVGFEALLDGSAPTSLTPDDFNDDAKIEASYYPEVIDTLKKVTGGHRVFIFDHTVRRLPPPGVEVPDTPSTRQPVSQVHVDQTPTSAVARVRRHLGDDAEELLKGRVRLINLWRPITDYPVYDRPLAFADFNTLPSDALQPSDLIYSPDNIGETMAVAYSPNTRWYYLRHQTINEATLLQCYDSLRPAKAHGEQCAALTPHTAFIDDEYAGKDVPRRASIEVRALVFG